jgi:hypothetical protein
VRRITLVGPLSAAILLPLSLAAQPASMGWPEVIGALVTERTNAETCVGLIKSRGDAATIDGTKFTYSMARGEMDGLIAGLETVLAEGGKPGNLPTVRPGLEATASSLKAICILAFATATPNTKGVWDELARGVA